MKLKELGSITKKIGRWLPLEYLEFLDTEGQAHFIGSPAVLWSDGSIVYYIHGKKHRLEGPAYYDTDEGVIVWAIDGITYNTEEEFIEALQRYQLRQALQNET